jgi:hypothetical protein
MVRFIRLSDYTWWIWFVTASVLLAGLVMDPVFFLVGIAITVGQAAFFAASEKSLTAFPVQLRLAYLILVLGFYIPPLRPGYWVPVIGTYALCLFGYCLLARCLSLLPWNRTTPLTFGELVWTFITPPRLDVDIEGKPASGCPGGVCTLEVQLGKKA